MVLSPDATLHNAHLFLQLLTPERAPGGMDEAFLDVTREARRRVSGGDVGQYQGHVHHNQVCLRE